MIDPQVASGYAHMEKFYIASESEESDIISKVLFNSLFYVLCVFCSALQLLLIVIKVPESDCELCP